VFFFKNQDGECECFFFLAFSYLFILSFFLHFVIFYSTFCYLYIEKSMSLFLSFSTFQVMNMGFLNEMWCKGLIQRILGCGDFFFPEKAKDLTM